MNLVRKLIIHADDYGLVPSVSRGIIKAHADGLVTSTSILANIITGDEITWLLKTPSLDVGVHLTLTSGPAALPREEVNHLVDENGIFHKRGSLNRPVKDGLIDFANLPESEILVEFEAQLFKAINHGIEPTHLDTHHHIHSDPKVLSTVIHIAREYRLAVRSISQSMRDTLRSSGIPTNDHFEGRFFGAGSITSAMMSEIISGLKPGITEMMCHPGEYSDELKAVSGYVSEREIELSILTNKEIKKEVISKKAELTGWQDVVL